MFAENLEVANSRFLESIANAVLYIAEQYLEKQVETEELKPCPFCKTDKYLDIFWDALWCVRCGNHTEFVIGPTCATRGVAIWEWNNRP
jgi:hypothetical protein